MRSPLLRCDPIRFLNDEQIRGASAIIAALHQQADGIARLVLMFELIGGVDAKNIGQLSHGFGRRLLGFGERGMLFAQQIVIQIWRELGIAYDPLARSVFFGKRCLDGLDKLRPRANRPAGIPRLVNSSGFGATP